MVARAARESELASARLEHEWRSRDVRTREQELAGMAARLHSLEEIDTHRGGFADAARMVLVNANGKVGQMGALADFIEVEPKYERAVEACLGDLLQHVLVERLEHVSAGLKLIRQEDAGRCGFVVGTAFRGHGVPRTCLRRFRSEAAAWCRSFRSMVRRRAVSASARQRRRPSSSVHAARRHRGAVVGRRRSAGRSRRRFRR